MSQPEKVGMVLLPIELGPDGQELPAEDTLAAFLASKGMEQEKWEMVPIDHDFYPQAHRSMLQTAIQEGVLVGIGDRASWRMKVASVNPVTGELNVVDKHLRIFRDKSRPLIIVPGSDLRH